MLIQFAVENFLSFKDKTVFSMVASPNVQAHPNQVCAGPDGLKLLRCAAIYGANASGKSNLIKALHFAAKLITDGIRPGRRIGVTPFKLSAAPATASRFELEIALAGRRYSYGLVVSPRQVRAEWLYRSAGGPEEVVFEREAAGEEPSQIRLGPVYGEERQRVEFVAEGTRPEQPFLAEADERNVAEIKPLVAWLRERLHIIKPETEYAGLALDAERKPELLAFLSEHLRDAGTGVTALRTRRRKRELGGEGLKEVNEVFKGALEQALEQAAFMDTRRGTLVRGEEGAFEEIQLVTERAITGGPSVTFDLNEESDGTRRLLHLAPVIHQLRSLKEGDVHTYAIDELERSLHPLLTRRYLEQYLALPCAGQLLFTTHDTNLLDLDLLRADEVWFVEKDVDQGTRMYSLAEFKPEQLQALGSNLEKGYLNGRFGAIPFLGKAQQLGLADKT